MPEDAEEQQRDVTVRISVKTNRQKYSICRKKYPNYHTKFPHLC